MRGSTAVQADKSPMFYIWKKPGFEDTVCTFTVAAAGPVIVVSSNTNTLDWNANSQTTANLALQAIKEVTNAASSAYPIDAEYGATKKDDTVDDNLQIVDSTSITMVTGRKYPVYWDTSNCLHSGIAFRAGSKARLMSMAGKFTGTGSENCTLHVYNDPLSGEAASEIYGELLSAAALSATPLSSTMLNQGIVSRLDANLLIRVARGTNLSVATWGVGLASTQDLATV